MRPAWLSDTLRPFRLVIQNGVAWNPSNQTRLHDMNSSIRIKLSIMMFLQFFVWGAWYVTAPNYLGTIGFQSTDIGNTYSVSYTHLTLPTKRIV